MGNFPRDGENFPLVAPATRVSSRGFLGRNALTIWSWIYKEGPACHVRGRTSPSQLSLEVWLRVMTPRWQATCQEAFAGYPGGPTRATDEILASFNRYRCSLSQINVPSRISAASTR